MKVTFHEEGHRYLADNGEEYISVTTLIDKYKKPFDAIYWSEYKAIERYFKKHKGDGEWENVKRMVGYKNVVRFFDKYAKPTEKKLMYSYQREILMEWDSTRELACLQGSDYHAIQEANIKKELYHKVENAVHFTAPQDIVDYDYSQIPDGLYSELLIYSNDLKIAGQADVVIVEKPYFDINDFKTNKKLKKESYYNRRTGKYDVMRPPVDHLMDCNFMHYSLQLSMYAYLLTLYGLKPRNLWIDHVQRDRKNRLNPTNIVRHPIKYLDEEVRDIIKHYQERGGKV